MAHQTFKVLATALAGGGLMVSTATAWAGELVASGCHIGNHPHVESHWAWLVLLLVPLALRGRYFGRR